MRVGQRVGLDEQPLPRVEGRLGGLEPDRCEQAEPSVSFCREDTVGSHRQVFRLWVMANPWAFPPGPLRARQWHVSRAPVHSWTTLHGGASAGDSRARRLDHPTSLLARPTRRSVVGAGTCKIAIKASAARWACQGSDRSQKPTIRRVQAQDPSVLPPFGGERRHSPLRVA